MFLIRLLIFLSLSTDASHGALQSHLQSFLARLQIIELNRTLVIAETTHGEKLHN